MNKLITAFVISFIFSCAIYTYSTSVHADLENGLVRLHIIANSDSDEDQEVKLKVRDEILKSGCKTISEYKITADRVLKENGFSYTSHAEYGNFYFPNKSYKNLTLPAGRYNGLRVILGNGNGQNWWCVLYPPLCVSDNNEMTLSKNSQDILKNNLSPESYDVVTEKNGKVIVKFKIVEAIEKLKEYCSKSK